MQFVTISDQALLHYEKYSYGPITPTVEQLDHMTPVESHTDLLPSTLPDNDSVLVEVDQSPKKHKSNDDVVSTLEQERLLIKCQSSINDFSTRSTSLSAQILQVQREQQREQSYNTVRVTETYEFLTSAVSALTKEHDRTQKTLESVLAVLSDAANPSKKHHSSGRCLINSYGLTVLLLVLYAGFGVLLSVHHHWGSEAIDDLSQEFFCV